MEVVKKYHNVHEVDVIGDVHGCFAELIELIERELGYTEGEDGLYRHSDGRKPVFVGDLTDRGPKNRECIEFAIRHIDQGLAYGVKGNHCDKLHRFAKGNPVQVSHGMQKTVDELEKEYDEDELFHQIHEPIKEWPLSLEFDDGELMVCHAAPPPEDCSTGKAKSVCLYGHTTGNQTEDGFPERANWQESWANSYREPYVIHGHVTHREVNVTEQTCCVDTACYAGNKLTAMRWPEKEIVSVESQQEERDINFGEDRDKPAVKVYGDVPEPEELHTLHLRELLDDLKKREEEILYLIDHDDDLRHRVHGNGLVIANAAVDLFEPEYHHQLYAKGIVYKRDPYRLVSLPLIKMYNHGRKGISDELSAKLEVDFGIDFEWNEKVDGAMIQLFEHDGEAYFTTRSLLEGTHYDVLEKEGFAYVGKARELAEKMNPRLTDPSFVDGKTMVFEMINSEGEEGVTSYEDDEFLTLLDVYDQYENRYWKSHEVKDFAERNNLRSFEIVLESSDLEQGVDRVRKEMEEDPRVPEGAVLQFENDEEVFHRVKIKTEEWIRLFKLKCDCSYKNTVNMLWDRPELWDWDDFLQYLRDEGMSEEEIEEFYYEHFQHFMDWIEEVKGHKERIEGILESYYEENGRIEDAEGESEYNKKMAIQFQEELSHREFTLVMDAHRNDDGVELKEVMKRWPAHTDLRGEIIYQENQNRDS
jgi:hypothetical protein